MEFKNQLYMKIDSIDEEEFLQFLIRISLWKKNTKIVLIKDGRKSSAKLFEYISKKIKDFAVSLDLFIEPVPIFIASFYGNLLLNRDKINTVILYITAANYNYHYCGVKLLYNGVPIKNFIYKKINKLDIQNIKFKNAVIRYIDSIKVCTDYIRALNEIWQKHLIYKPNAAKRILLKNNIFIISQDNVFKSLELALKNEDWLFYKKIIFKNMFDFFNDDYKLSLTTKIHYLKAEDVLAYSNNNSVFIINSDGSECRLFCNNHSFGPQNLIAHTFFKLYVPVIVQNNEAFKFNIWGRYKKGQWENIIDDKNLNKIKLIYSKNKWLRYHTLIKTGDSFQFILDCLQTKLFNIKQKRQYEYDFISELSPSNTLKKIKTVYKDIKNDNGKFVINEFNYKLILKSINKKCVVNFIFNPKLSQNKINKILNHFKHKYFLKIN